MIRSLRGEVARINEQSILLVVHDVGYLIFTPVNKLKVLPQETITLHTYLAVRENALDLYGFTTEAELDFFIILLTLPKVGPKSALQILVHADLSLLCTAINTDDPVHLQKMSSLSKKTSETIVNGLKGKIDQFAIYLEQATESKLLNPAQIDAIDALITLGYEAKEARNYVTKLEQTADTKTLVQAVLKQIPLR